MNENSETTEQLKCVIKYFEIAQTSMPLPSGRYGNSLAVALEMQEYKGALYMIQNADELGINLESVSSVYGENVWSAQQTFEFSQVGFEMEKTTVDDEFCIDYPRVVQSNNSNIDAALEISKIFQNKTK